MSPPDELMLHWLGPKGAGKSRLLRTLSDYLVGQLGPAPRNSEIELVGPADRDDSGREVLLLRWRGIPVRLRVYAEADLRDGDASFVKGLQPGVAVIVVNPFVLNPDAATRGFLGLIAYLQEVRHYPFDDAVRVAASLIFDTPEDNDLLTRFLTKWATRQNDPNRPQLTWDHNHAANWGFVPRPSMNLLQDLKLLATNYQGKLSAEVHDRLRQVARRVETSIVVATHADLAEFCHGFPVNYLLTLTQELFGDEYTNRDLSQLIVTRFHRCQIRDSHDDHDPRETDLLKDFRVRPDTLPPFQVTSDLPSPYSAWAFGPERLWRALEVQLERLLPRTPDWSRLLVLSSLHALGTLLLLIVLVPVAVWMVPDPKFDLRTVFWWLGVGLIGFCGLVWTQGLIWRWFWRTTDRWSRLR